jgi:DNA invertase Pin-like site-specific DNA recombinase
LAGAVAVSDAFYARVSTAEQTVDTQLARLREVAPGAVEYVDAGVSGRGAFRPEFERLRESILSGSISTVFVTKLDRLGRSAKTILGFFEDADVHSVRVVVLDQQIDTSNPVGRMIRPVLAAMAELEGDLIGERTREAMAAFKAGTRVPKGKVGRPRRVTPEIAAKISELRGTGLPWKDVARRVGLPAETCRKASWLLKRAGRTVDNPPSSQTVRSTPEELPR